MQLRFEPSPKIIILSSNQRISSLFHERVGSTALGILGQVEQRVRVMDGCLDKPGPKPLRVTKRPLRQKRKKWLEELL